MCQTLLLPILLLSYQCLFSCCYLVLCSLVLFLFMYTGIYYLCDFFSLFCVSVQNYILG